ETMEAVAQLKEQGKIREAAVCNYSVEQMQEAEQSVSLASNQVPYSMLLRDIEEEVVPYCKEQNKGILAYSPLQRGILTGKMKVGQEFSDGDGRTDSPYYWDERSEERRVGKERRRAGSTRQGDQEEARHERA